MNKDDLLFAFGFHSVNPFLQVALDQAALHGTPVIFVTDTLGDLVGDRATVILSARRGPVSGFHSMTVPMTIVNTLLLAMSSVDQEKVMTNLDRLDQLRDNVQHLNSQQFSAKKI
jgi:DNA-binding MurR/RpiR family transcriptional regulator